VVDLAFAAILIDGVPVKRKVAPAAALGLLPQMRVGGQVSSPLVWDELQDRVDAGKPHVIQVKAAGEASETVPLLTTTALGDAWDAATPKLGPAPAPAVQVSGEVRDETGQPAVGYELELLGGTAGEQPHFYDEVTDGHGRYTFMGVPTGEYELTCVPGGRKSPLIVVEKVDVQPAKPLSIPLSFEGKFAIRGRVDRPKEDDTPAGPAAGSTVRATFASADGTIEVNTSAVTGADGTYVIKGPFPRVTFVGVMSSPEPAPVKDVVAPKEGVDFRLVSEAEERRRVQ
jgi:hypothetical protein